ncbi:hypothetical protein I3271_03355 [Photobacterium leiognathi]|uniref:hypothetical protein n=1 Tax=Photobacterium leiognathi TaxID=553611 RepID=UPI001EDE26B2|nr:hypothetical protein [Photobacterium leiognathi]MCG3883718.1 hypothetical protein [Photobacterium leiognathi]
MKRIALCFGLMSLNVGTFAEVIPINEIKTDTHIWVDIFDIPYVRAKALQFGVNGNPLNDVGCGPLRFRRFLLGSGKNFGFKKSLLS